ncbi:flagellar motor control protein ZomB [Tsukamurella sp. 8F]|uniref:flagellar motor control protein ZomB n=1 Tax=unclassified Tsukamurella TaxID=2633480 RepID=UPI0023B913F0|nr:MULTISPECIES: flagellar motor control protein ZomB [unclassified Tsukamurella]MDF0530788.1 flagellar motor control protein ZomB [Tsukamurella sp. 8J]MDF0588314.1 flagellar motor control protein ZomB [Tsukamurella sp. 8F]
MSRSSSAEPSEPRRFGPPDDPEATTASFSAEAVQSALRRRAGSAHSRRDPDDTLRAELKDAFPLPRVTLWLGVLTSAVLFGYGAWQRRWIADDGLIVLRTVRNLLAGNGPVFNQGERVEVNTSAAWTYIVWFFTWISDVQIEYVVLAITLVLTVLTLPIAMLGTARLYKGGPGWSGLHGSGLLLLPAGGFVYMALPPARDFATSGLESSLTIFWIAGMWWLTLVWAQRDPDARDRGDKAVTYGLAFVAGLSWLVRPDMALIGAMVLALMFVSPIGAGRRIGIVLAGGLLPVAYQVFRMGYYGLPVPNTAIAKDANGSKWTQGFDYLWNLVDPYSLWLPVLALVIGAPLVLLTVVGLRRDPRPVRTGSRIARVRAALRSPTVVVILFLLGGLAEGTYWLRQGGDFMSGRVLLAPLFILLLPVMVLPLRIPSRAPAASEHLRGRLTTAARVLGGSAGAAVAAVLWVLVIGWALYASTFRGQPDGTYIGRSGIVDERSFYSMQTGHSHPVTAQDYLDYPRMRSLQQWLQATPRGGVYLPSYDYDWWYYDPLPYPKPADVQQRQTVFFLNLGMTSMNTDLSVRIWDQVGLAWPTATHTSRLTDGRIGHDKDQYPDWAIAETRAMAKHPLLPYFIDPDWVNQARVALQCPAMKQLHQSYAAPLTWDLFKRNIKLSFATMRFRIDRTPEYTLQMCGQKVPPPLPYDKTVIKR